MPATAAPPKPKTPYWLQRRTPATVADFHAAYDAAVAEYKALSPELQKLTPNPTKGGREYLAITWEMAMRWYFGSNRKKRVPAAEIAANAASAEATS
jgi:hypothetical protein